MSETTLGAALRDARESAGLTLDEVCARTRIRSTVLRDLEADRVTSSGGLVYARGHVKSICLAIGVDPGPYLQQFVRQHGGEPPVPLAEPAPVRAVPSLRVPHAARPERRGPNWAVAGAAAMTVLLALLLVGQVAPSDAPGVGSADAAAPVATASPDAGKARVRPVARPVRTAAVLRLQLVAGDSWVRVRNGAGRVVFEGMLRDGAVRDFQDPTSLRLVVDNAGALRLTCSGRTLAPAGSHGAVRRFGCTRQGLVPA